MGLFENLNPFRLFANRNTISTKLFQSHAMISISAFQDLLEETPSRGEIEQVRESLWRTGKIAGQLADPILRKYWQCHFLHASADCIVAFLQDHSTAEMHYAGAAIEMLSLEQDGALTHKPLIDSLIESNAELKLASEASWGAAVAHYNQHGDLDSDQFRAYLDSALAALANFDYPLEKTFYLSLEMAPFMILSSNSEQNWSTTINAFGTAMNRLTASMALGSRPYDAIREYEDAALLFEFLIHSLTESGREIRAKELHQEAQFQEIAKPWRDDPSSKYRFMIEALEKNNQ